MRSNHLDEKNLTAGSGYMDQQKLVINKYIGNIPIRADADIDITAIRIGKQRVARKKIEKPSELKMAINQHRSNIQGKPHDPAPQLDRLNEQGGCESSSRPPFLDQIQSEELDLLVYKALRELSRLQAKGKDQPKERKYKYKKFVVGLREVQRAVGRNEVKGVIVSFNLESGVDALDKLILELKNTCEAREVPMFYALNKRKIGKALDKSMKQSIVGVVSLEGIYQDWRKILDMVNELRIGYKLKDSATTFENTYDS
jgi:ribosomal protein L7Ae-like RNA K-turn-binding protein